MMKLYYAPGACSLSPHIALREAGLPFEPVRVDFMRGKQLEGGGTLNDVNPKGYVPALVLDDGQLLTEGAVIVQYIADLAPFTNLAPPPGTFERVRLQELLNFIATELHKGTGPLYAKAAPEEYKQLVRDKVATRFQHLADVLGDKPFLLGDRFTIADGYALYAIRSWLRFKLPLPPVLLAYQERLEARPAVHAALEAEGLLAKAA
jgi:glutathione S-transferase